MKEMENSIRNILLEKYQLSRDRDRCLDMCKRLIKQSTKDAKELGDLSLAPKFRGEVTEVMLEICILDYLKDKQGCFISKSLSIYLPNREGKKTTELDLTLFTPHGIILFESKFRKGNIEINEDCIIEVKGRSNYNSNTLTQSLLHVKMLNEIIGDELPRFKKVYNLATFLIYEGSFVDNRSEKKMKIINDENFKDFMEVIFKKPIIIDTDSIKPIILNLDKYHDKIFKKHIGRRKI